MTTEGTRSEAIDVLASLEAEERAEREALEAQHAANEAEQRARDAAARAGDEEAGASEADEPEEDAADEGAEEPDEQPERLYAGKYRTVEEMERAYTEAQSTIGRLGNELGQARQQAPQPRQAPPAQAQPDQGMTQEEFEEWMVENPVQATAYLADLMAEQKIAALREELAPITRQVNDSAAQSALAQLKQNLGPDGAEMLEKYREDLISAIEQDQGHYVDPATRLRHMEQAVMAAAYRDGYQPKRRSSNGRRRAADGTFAKDVHVEGGSGAIPASQNGREPQLSAEEQELQQLDPVAGWKPPVDEKGIPLPWR